VSYDSIHAAERGGHAGMMKKEESTAKAQKAWMDAKFWDEAKRGGGEVAETGAEEYFEKPLAFATEMRHFRDMSMLTLTPTAARGNLSELLRRALKGDDIGIVVDGKIVALRPVGVESMDYATREYGTTVTELEHFEKRTHGQIEKANKEGKLHDFTGDIEALLEGKSH
jgi:antitoxin (DNA-binding transcriptional repressor) of toxin-antitoxin stability system